jgi:hypothetical protein
VITFKELNVADVMTESSSSESDTLGNISVKCPVCGSEYVSVSNMREVSGEDNYKAGWLGRGDLNVIGFSGECGHEFELCFGFHKGNTAAFCRIAVGE